MTVSLSLSQRCVWSLEDDRLALIRSATLPNLWDRPAFPGRNCVMSAKRLEIFSIPKDLRSREPNKDYLDNRHTCAVYLLLYDGH